MSGRVGEGTSSRNRPTATGATCTARVLAREIWSLPPTAVPPRRGCLAASRSHSRGLVARLDRASALGSDAHPHPQKGGVQVLSGRGATAQTRAVHATPGREANDTELKASESAKSSTADLAASDIAKESSGTQSSREQKMTAPRVSIPRFVTALSPPSRRSVPSRHLKTRERSVLGGGFLLVLNCEVSMWISVRAREGRSARRVAGE